MLFYVENTKVAATSVPDHKRRLWYLNHFPWCSAVPWRLQLSTQQFLVPTDPWRTAATVHRSGTWWRSWETLGWRWPMLRGRKPTRQNQKTFQTLETQQFERCHWKSSSRFELGLTKNIIISLRFNITYGKVSRQQWHIYSQWQNNYNNDNLKNIFFIF